MEIKIPNVPSDLLTRVDFWQTRLGEVQHGRKVAQDQIKAWQQDAAGNITGVYMDDALLETDQLRAWMKKERGFNDVNYEAYFCTGELITFKNWNITKEGRVYSGNISIPALLHDEPLVIVDISPEIIMGMRKFAQSAPYEVETKDDLQP